MIAEEHVGIVTLIGKHPAHHVRADLVRAFIELDRVAPTLVHGAAIFAQQGGKAQHRLGGALVDDAGRHRQQRIEPVAELAGKRFGDEVRREPRAPVFRIEAIAQRAHRDNAGIEPRIAHVLDAFDNLAAPGALDLYRIDVRAMRRMPHEFGPAFNGAFFQFFARADHIEVAAVLAIVDRQRQAVVALLADHPVVHVAQPVELALFAEVGNPADVVGHVHHRLAQAVHADVPLVDEAEDQRRIAAPADWIAVHVIVEPIEAPLHLEVFHDLVFDFRDVHPGEPVKTVEVDAVFVERGDHRQIVALAELEVLGAAARRDVHDARAVFFADFFPQNDAMRFLRGDGQIVERAVVTPAFHVAALELFDNGVLALQHLQRALGQVQVFFALQDFDVGEIRPDGRSHVRGERPRRRRPHQQRGFRVAVAPVAEEREAHREAGIGLLDVALGDDLVLADAGAAAPAPRHHVVALVDPAAIVALLQEAPDLIVVLVAEGEVRAAQFTHAELAHHLLDRAFERSVGAVKIDRLVGVFAKFIAQQTQAVGIVPVHPVAQADRLLGLHGGIVQHTLLAQPDKRRDAVGFDVALALEVEIALDVHLDPQALAVEAVLPALILAQHGVIALVDVLVGAAPGVMHAHRVVGRDRAVEKRVALLG